jgi:hypothetical protein
MSGFEVAFSNCEACNQDIYILLVKVTGDETLPIKSVCLHLKVNMKKKIIYMSVNSNPAASQQI